MTMEDYEKAMSLPRSKDAVSSSLIGTKSKEGKSGTKERRSSALALCKMVYKYLGMGIP